MMNRLCDFTCWFSMLVAKELEEARLLGHQSRETTWTDRMLFELKRLRDPRIITVASNEPVTGADMDWWFVRRGSGVNFCLNVQAKILHYRQAKAALWHYEDIAHPAKTPGLQSRALVRHARRMHRAGTPAYPYYLFYNPESAGSPSPFRWFPSNGGVTVIDGFLVASHIAQHIGPGSFPIAEKRHAALAPMMAPLHDLFCVGPADIPDPSDVARRIDELRNPFYSTGKVTRAPKRLKPTVGEQLPPSIRGIVERSGRDLESVDGTFHDGVVRDTVVFISD